MRSSRVASEGGFAGTGPRCRLWHRRARACSPPRSGFRCWAWTWRRRRSSSPGRRLPTAGSTRSSRWRTRSSSTTWSAGSTQCSTADCSIRATKTSGRGTSRAVASATDHGGTLYVLCFSDEAPDIGPHPVRAEELRAAFDHGSGWNVVAIEPDAIQTTFMEAGVPGLVRDDHTPLTTPATAASDNGRPWLHSRCRATSFPRAAMTVVPRGWPGCPRRSRASPPGGRSTLGAPFEPGGVTAWVAPPTSPTSAKSCLKVGWSRHMEADDEAAGLREWDGDGAIRVFAEERLSATTTAMLLERCMPGTTLAERPEEEQDVVIAGLLQPSVAQPVRPAARSGHYRRCATTGRTASSARLTRGTWCGGSRARRRGRRRCSGPCPATATGAAAALHGPARRERARLGAGALAGHRPQALRRRPDVRRAAASPQLQGPPGRRPGRARHTHGGSPGARRRTPSRSGCSPTAWSSRWTSPGCSGSPSRSGPSGRSARRPSRRRAGAGRPRLAGRAGLGGEAGHQDLDDDLGVETADPAAVEVSRGDELDGRGDLLAPQPA